jgi:hypothetical protein
VLPLSGARWKQFVSKEWHNTALTLIGAAIYDLTGLLNVLLFVYTRQGVLFFDENAGFDGAKPVVPEILVHVPNTADDVGADEAGAGADEAGAAVIVIV